MRDRHLLSAMLAEHTDDIRDLMRSRGKPEVGYLVWTKSHYGEPGVRRIIDALKARGIKHLRTGLAWCEWQTPSGTAWIEWYLREYAKHFTVLPCLSFTPPELGIEPRVNAPPRDLDAYTRFVNLVLCQVGELFDTVELWNEWNLNTDWDPELDGDYLHFSRMVHMAALIAKGHGKRVLLGGASKVNGESLRLMRTFKERGLGEAIDVLGFHNLRGTWSDHMAPPSLRQQADLVRRAWRRDIPVWLTEYGFPVADPENRFNMEQLELIQVALFAYMTYACLAGHVERGYWYTLFDEVHESLRFATTGWEDVLQFYFGDTEENGRERLLARLLKEGGPLRVLAFALEENLFPLVDAASLKRNLVA